ncbi:predicted protein [Nematostella vectensis]|uniref:Uncharacterized protein n=1 Tax=Nematostella vectensis TaxID=45351 RepID=A7T685_NEMVE|nr:predicted protein [Nematostella vectensis]|eukprot:XP_001620624.1 hypothetical protein NEMVEDRAFT_v1g222906 [Nematostella vectensis]
MTSMEDKLTALTAKLQELEEQLKEQAPAQPDTTGPGTSSASCTAYIIRVSVTRDRRIPKYDGTRNYRVLEDWISDAQRAVKGQANGEAVDHLILHLEGVAKDEVKLRPTSQWSDPAGVFKILREVFGVGLTIHPSDREADGARVRPCPDAVSRTSGETQRRGSSRQRRPSPRSVPGGTPC